MVTKSFVCSDQTLSFGTHLDDTLHTPHVFPNLGEQENPQKQPSGKYQAIGLKLFTCSMHYLTILLFNIKTDNASNETVVEKVVRQEADTSHKNTSPKPQYE